MALSPLPLISGCSAGAGAFAFALGIRGVAPSRRQGRPTVTPEALMAAGLGIVVWVGVFALTRWVVAASVAALSCGPLLRRVRREREAGLAQRAEAVAAWTEMLRDTLSAAAGLEEAILSTAPVAPPLVRSAVQRLAARIRHEPLAAALRRFRNEVAEPTADLVVAALSLAAERPARDLAPLLGALAQSARQLATMVLRVEAGRARLRTAVRVVTGFTLAFAGGMILLNRSYLDPFDDALGQLTLLLIAGVFAAALWQLDRMARIATPDRVFATGERAAEVPR